MTATDLRRHFGRHRLRNRHRDVRLLSPWPRFVARSRSRKIGLGRRVTRRIEALRDSGYPKPKAAVSLAAHFPSLIHRHHNGRSAPRFDLQPVGPRIEMSASAVLSRGKPRKSGAGLPLWNSSPRPGEVQKVHPASRCLPVRPQSCFLEEVRDGCRQSAFSSTCGIWLEFSKSTHSQPGTRSR